MEKHQKETEEQGTMEQKQFIQGEITARRSLLADTDYKCLKFADGSLTEEEYAPDQIPTAEMA